jgi:hypothetical protein
MWARLYFSFLVNETSCYGRTKRTQQRTRAELTRAGQRQAPIRERRFSNRLARQPERPDAIGQGIQPAHEYAGRKPARPPIQESTGMKGATISTAPWPITRKCLSCCLAILRLPMWQRILDTFLVGRVTPCAREAAINVPNGAHGVARPTALLLQLAVPVSVVERLALRAVGPRPAARVRPCMLAARN